MSYDNDLLDPSHSRSPFNKRNPSSPFYDPSAPPPIALEDRYLHLAGWVVFFGFIMGFCFLGWVLETVSGNLNNLSRGPMLDWGTGYPWVIAFVGLVVYVTLTRLLSGAMYRAWSPKK